MTGGDPKIVSSGDESGAGSDTSQVTMVSWNMNGLAAAWDELAADATIDVALVQEAKQPPSSGSLAVVSAAEDWTTGGAPKRSFCAAVASRSGDGRPTVTPIERVGVSSGGSAGASEAVEMEG